VQLTFDTSAINPDPGLKRKPVAAGEEFDRLPSWVPNWAGKTHRDPEPLLDWSQTLPRYWASGRTQAQFLNEDDPQILAVHGFIFDEIAQVGLPWHPENDIPPVSRKNNDILKQWEQLALAEYPKCPYGGIEGRKNALWRTHIADYASAGAVPPSHERYLECWYDRIGWANDLPSVGDLLPKSLWKNATITVNAKSDSVFSSHITDLDTSEVSLNPFKLAKTIVKQVVEEPKIYGQYLKRIQRVCAHRMLFVTRRGYMGLAPWNARVGDLVTVLDGGKTPFLLRLLPAGAIYSLVGESYVHGIMGGEALNWEQAAASSRYFQLA
jgi:hypothetical protein